MKLKQLSWFFIFNFFLFFSQNHVLSAKVDVASSKPEEREINGDGVKVKKGTHPSQIVLKSIPEHRAFFSEPVTFNAYVISSFVAEYIPIGSVRLEIDGVPIAVEPLKNGAAKFNLFLPPAVDPLNKYSIEVIYLGDEFFAESREYMTYSVLPANTKIELSATPNPSSFGKPVEFNVSMQSTGSAIAVPTGAVKFYIDAVNIGTVNLDKNGKASFLSSEMNAGNMNPGNHAITAIYQGNENFTSSKADLTQQVEKTETTIQLKSLENPSLYHQAINVQAKISSVYGIPSGVIQFVLDGVNVGGTVSLDENGQGATTIPNLESGSHILEAYYLGDQRFNSSNITLAQQVNPIPTTISLESSNTPSHYGESIGMTAKITSTTDLQPIGYLQFKIDGKVYGVPQLLPRSGVVTMNIHQLKTGFHDIAVDYFGNENFLPSQALFKQEVSQEKVSLSVFSSTNPSLLGDLVTFTAIISASKPVGGTILFKVNGREVDSALLVGRNNQVSIDLSKELKEGTTEVIAIYSGDDTFSSSSSPPLLQVVKPVQLPVSTEIKNESE